MAWNKDFNPKKSFYKKAEKAQYKTKRGKLSPLMAEEDKQKASIHELSYDFACRITRLYQWGMEGFRESGSGFLKSLNSEIPSLPNFPFGNFYRCQPQ